VSVVQDGDVRVGVHDRGVVVFVGVPTGESVGVLVVVVAVVVGVCRVGDPPGSPIAARTEAEFR
jgi:hypothetical protein